MIISEQPFQSTRPVWGATQTRQENDGTEPFQSTRPVWGATQVGRVLLDDSAFQSTRPVWGATVWSICRRVLPPSFQSTRPVWGATPLLTIFTFGHIVSIHAPRVGRDTAAGF